MSDLFNERVGIFKDATRQTKPKRIPLLSNVWSWKIIDSPYKFTEALMDYDKLEKTLFDFHEKYNFDGYLEISDRNPIQVTYPMGQQDYVIRDEDYSINTPDHAMMMKDDEYDALSENMLKFLWEKALPRKFSGFNEPDVIERLKTSGKELLKFQAYLNKMFTTFQNDYHVPLLTPNGDFIQGGSSFPPDMTQFLSVFFRGILGFSVDMRRHPDKIIALNEHNFKTVVKPQLDAIRAGASGSCPTTLFDYSGGTIHQNSMNIKQFEKFFWPYFKPVMDVMCEKDKLVYIFIEGDIGRFSEFYQDIPKGHLVLNLENDNIFEMKKKLPNITFAGGMPCELLYSGTKQQCIDYAKKLIDEVGYDGSYIFSQNRMVSFKNDCTAENLLAVNNFVREYGIMK